MSLILIFVIIIVGSVLGKILFRKWFNPLTLYCIIFGGTVFFYELKLLPYPKLTAEAWFVMISSFLSFLMGILTIIFARNINKENPTFIRKSNISLKIFSDDGKTLKYAIIFFSILSAYAAIEYWMILIKQFGSIPAVLLNGKVIYRLNVDGEIKGTTPYIYLFAFVPVFLVGIYTAYKKRFTLLTFIPLISIIIREIAGAGRIGMLIALMEFGFSFFLFRHLLNSDLSERFKFSKKNAAIATTILLVLFIAGASIVRLSRTAGSAGTSENFKGESKELKQTNGDIVISPSVYLYASSTIGVLGKYLESEGDGTDFGQNTFQTVYLFLAKLGVMKRVSEYQKGYYIPMWTNNGTYIRELHADFGITGVFVGPYLIGLLITWFWFKFYEEKKIIVFAFLVYFFLIIGFSFLLMVTRFYYWTLSLFIILLIIPILEKIATLMRSRVELQVDRK